MYNKLIITKEDISDTEILLSVSIPKDLVCSLLQKELLHVKSNKALPGFRKGKVPQQLAEKNWLEQAKSSFINREIPLILQKSAQIENISFIGSPCITHISKLSPEESFSLQCKMVRPPYVKILSLENFSIPKIKLQYELEKFIEIETKRVLREKAILKDTELVDLDKFQVLTLDILHIREESDSNDLSAKEFQLETSPWIYDPLNLKSYCVGMNPNESREIQIDSSLIYTNSSFPHTHIKFLITLKKIQTIQIPENITNKSSQDILENCEKSCNNRILFFSFKKKKEIIINNLLPQASFCISEKFWEITLEQSREKISIQQLQNSLMKQLQENLIMKFLFDLVVIDVEKTLEKCIQYISFISKESPQSIRKNLMKDNRYKKFVNLFQEMELVEQLYEKFSKNSTDVEEILFSYLDIS